MAVIFFGLTPTGLPAFLLNLNGFPFRISRPAQDALVLATHVIGNVQGLTKRRIMFESKDWSFGG
jgi:hypothetical protein